MSSLTRKDLIPKGTKVIIAPPAPPSARRSILSDSDECWTSTSTLPTSIHLIFPLETPVSATHIALSFQGGFVGTSASIYIGTKPEKEQGDVGLGLILAGKIHLEDKNARQIFEIPYPPTISRPGAEGSNATLTELKIEFETSSDAHGRITLYRVELLG